MSLRAVILSAHRVCMSVCCECVRTLRGLQRVQIIQAKFRVIASIYWVKFHVF